MGIDAMEIRIQTRRFLIISIRTCYRSVCNHPFLVGMVCFLIFMCRSFPFAFSLLVSASPVLVCTAVLLGTLLSFGQPNIPEIDREEKVTHEIASLKTGVVDDTTTVVERDECFPVEKYKGKRRDMLESANGEKSLVESEVVELAENGAHVDYTPLIDEDSLEIQYEKLVNQEVEREFDDVELEKKRKIQEKMGFGEILGDGEVNQAEKVVGENLELEDDKSPGQSSDAHTEDQLDSPLRSSWNRVRNNEDDGDVGDNEVDGDDDDDNDSEDSGSDSDAAESSSPDASMADIIPMLDELHPLLDLESSQPAHVSPDRSIAASEGSDRSNEGSVESEEDTENQGEEDDNDEEGEQESHGGKDDGSKSAIKWTEDDEKNLMDLGTSELERNQRLENLIARRRARKNFRTMTEKNLIDLESADLPFNIPSISTTRRNPFDLPYDSYADLGLPPIPGSAPSVLLPRRNPFDLPYDSSEEKPDLKGDSFQHEFTTNQRDVFFRRHESFSSGPSIFGGSRQERQDVRWKPFFIPEPSAMEGSNYTSFQRQLSGISESKGSSVPDTESVGSVVDQEDKQLNEQEFSEETELMSNLDQASLLVERGSQSSEDVDSLEVEQAEKRDVPHDDVEITLGEVESHCELELSLSETGAVAASSEIETSMQERTEQVEDEYSSRSSLSSLSEIDEKISDVRKEEGLANLEPKGDHINELDFPKQPSLEESEFQFTSGVVDETHHKEPVYDSSPPAVEKILSFSSISSDSQGEISEMVLGPASVELAGKETKDLAASEQLCTVDQIEPQSSEIAEASEPYVTKVELSTGSNFDKDYGSVVPEALVDNVIHSSLSCSVIQSAENGMTDAKESLHHKQEQERSLTLNLENPLDLSKEAAVELDSEDSIYLRTSADIISSSQEDQPTIINEHVSEDHTISSSETESVEEGAIEKADTLQLEHDETQSSSSSESGALEEATINTFQPLSNQVHPSSLGAEVHVDSCEGTSSVAPSNQDMSSNDLRLSEPEETSTRLGTEQVSVVDSHLSSPQSEDMAEYPLNKEETKFEQNRVHLSSFDAKNDAGPRDQVLDVQAVSLDSNDQHAISEEKHVFESEKQLSWEDKSIVESSLVGHNEPPEQSIIPAESTEDVNGIDRENVLEVHDSEVKQSKKISSLTYDSVSVPFESPEFRSPTGKEIVGGIVCEDHGEVPEHINNGAETYGSQVAEEDTSEEPDEIKDIDEALLSELDAVGDFSVKEVVGESLHVGSTFEETQARSTESGSLADDSGHTETSLELPILEARSLEDVDLAFKQLDEGVDVEEVIVPSMLKDQLVEDEPRNPVAINSDLPVVEAKSLEDIQVALKQVSESNYGSVELEANEVATTKEIRSNNMEADKQDSRVSVASESKHESEGTSENRSLSISKEGEEATKLHRSESVSSSSSSSSSSDSD